MDDYPFSYSALSLPSDEILGQEITTYIKRGKSILKITVKRDFFKDDYTDGMTTEVIYAGDEDV